MSLVTSDVSGGAKAPKPARDVFKLVGTTVADKYAVDGVIGEGGYGVVYAARHLLIGRSIALKCMKPLGTSAEDTARATGLFLREAQVLFGPRRRTRRHRARASEAGGLSVSEPPRAARRARLPGAREMAAREPRPRLTS